MKKSDRQIVFNKYGGKCAYCGCVLRGKWAVDHIEPIGRKTKMVGNCYVHRETKVVATTQNPRDENFHKQFVYMPIKHVPDGCDKPHLDVIDNMNPACLSCNNYKSSMTVEWFRKNVGELVRRLNENFNQYSIAKRFGLVEETGKPVIFYFETFNKPTP